MHIRFLYAEAAQGGLIAWKKRDKEELDYLRWTCLSVVREMLLLLLIYLCREEEISSKQEVEWDIYKL